MKHINTEQTPISEKNTNQIPLFGNEEHMFFSKEEMSLFLKDDFKTILLQMDNGMPYLNYEVSKKVFESVVGNNYSIELLSYEFMPEFDVFMVHARFTLVRGDKKICKDVIGCEKAIRNKETNEISNFHNLPKSAVKDAFKKFLNDYIGIGSAQYMAAKREYEERAKKSKQNAQYNYQQDGQVYHCTDCKASITPKIYAYSVNYHSEKRPLCPNCQKKYQ